jgi:hypothetical protein
MLEDLNREQLDMLRERYRMIRGSCNSHYTNYQCGVVRGMLWAMLGYDPGPLSADDINALSKEDKDDHLQ